MRAKPFQAVRDYWYWKEVYEKEISRVDTRRARQKLFKAKAEVLLLGIHHLFGGRIPTLDEYEEWRR